MLPNYLKACAVKLDLNETYYFQQDNDAKYITKKTTE